MNKDVIAILKELGLSEKEIQLYLVLLSSGVQTIKQIADAAGMNRTTAYRFLEALKHRGLVEWVVGPRGTLVQAAPPDALLVYLHEQEHTFAGLEAALPMTIADLALLKSKKKFSTQVRYFEGQLGIKQMIWNTLKADRLARSYASLTRREVISASFEDEFEREWAKRGMTDRVITNETRKEYMQKKLIPEYHKHLEIRELPAKIYSITNDIIIYNNVFAIMSLEKENLVGVEIENREIAATQQSIFDIVWHIAKPLK